MTDTKEILDAVPTGVPLSTGDVAAAIDACLRCVQTCTTCANADLAERDVDELSVCAARCITCADVCDVTARVLVARRNQTSSSSTACSRPASARARAAPRSAPGTLTITVTAQSARRSAGHASKRAPRCSTPRPCTRPKTRPAPDSHLLGVISGAGLPHIELASGADGRTEAHASEIGTRGDVELGEHLSEVIVDRARAEKQLCTDLGVRQTPGGEIGYAAALEA